MKIPLLCLAHFLRKLNMLIFQIDSLIRIFCLDIFLGFLLGAI